MKIIFATGIYSRPTIAENTESFNSFATVYPPIIQKNEAVKKNNRSRSCDSTGIADPNHLRILDIIFMYPLPKNENSTVYFLPNYHTPLKAEKASRAKPEKPSYNHRINIDLQHIDFINRLPRSYLWQYYI